MKEIPIKGIAYSLALLPWDLFATLTFPNPLPRESARWSLAWRHLQRISDTFDRPYSSLRIALRYERGELNDRPHFHYLLGGTRSRNLHTACEQTAWDWHQATGGHAEVRLYTPGLDLTAYVDKCLGGNLYELKKYNKAGELELSRSVLKAISSLREDGSLAVVIGDDLGCCGSVDPKGPVQDGGGQTSVLGVSTGKEVKELQDRDVSSPPHWRKTAGVIHLGADSIPIL